MSPRISGGRLASLRRQLSERDMAILSDVQRVRLLTARQIERLHFADGPSKASNARRARRVCKRLHEAGLLHRLERRVGGVHAGSAGFIYTLASPAQQLMNSAGPAGGARRRRPWEPSHYFIDHLLEVAELYVLLREHERDTADFTLRTFQAEPAAWRTWTALGGQRLTLKPDAFVAIASRDQTGPYEQVSFVEVDRSTEHRPTIRRKLGVYIDAYRAGVEQSRGRPPNDSPTPFPNVVWIVPNRARAELIRSEIDRLDGNSGHADLFAVTTNTPSNQLNIIEGGEP